MVKAVYKVLQIDILQGDQPHTTPALRSRKFVGFERDGENVISSTVKGYLDLQ